METFFMLQWWNGKQYIQEYYQTMEALSNRYCLLRDNVEGSNPSIETCHMSD